MSFFAGYFRTTPREVSPRLLRRSADVPTEGALVQTPWASARAAEGGVRLFCAKCSAFITESRAAVEVAGAHVHSFQNPLGLVYTVRCFESAPGVRGVGEESHYHTWFTGFAWQVVVCAVCRDHVGWRFSGGAGVFFALIGDRLVEGPQRAAPG